MLRRTLKRAKVGGKMVSVAGKTKLRLLLCRSVKKE